MNPQFEGRLFRETTPVAYRYGQRVHLLQALFVLKQRQADADKRSLTDRERGEILTGAKRLRDELMDTRFMPEQREAMAVDDLGLVREMLSVCHDIIERLL